MNRIIFLMMFLMSLFSFPIDITGPNYRLDLNVAAGYRPNSHRDNNMLSEGDHNNLDIEVGFSLEWTLKINDKFDIVFGPKLTLSLFTTLRKSENDNTKHFFIGISSGVRVDFDYILKKNIKLYTGLETALTVRPDVHVGSTKVNNSYISLNMHPTALARFAIGTKIKRYNVGLYTGYGFHKELVGGIEVGYSF
ncbi:hypothetical protein [Streptobacillus moniliformis]|uniref:hypothetical protein n=1 Tax=Streptobacillus moniliformis TaxID=34105 RepID=UPI0007E36106|nr:hypothetical protein [Streptobacillus moniliformis]